MDLKKALKEDKLYKEALEKLKEEPEQQKAVESYVESFVEAWDENFFKLIEEKMADQEFIKEVRKQLTLKSGNDINN